MRSVGAVLLSVLTPACSLLFDARELADSGGDPPLPRAGPIVQFAVQPLSIAVGDTASLVWDTEGAGEVAIREDGERIASDVDGELLVQPDRTTTYAIEAGGETREISVFVDQDVPPEIIDFSLSPRVLTNSNVEARWRVSQGSVSLLDGDRILDDLDPAGEVSTNLDATSELVLFAFAGGSTEHRESAFAYEKIGAEQPHDIGVDAVELEQNEELQVLLWNLPGRSTLRPEIVDENDDCADAIIVLTQDPEGRELLRLEDCEPGVVQAEGRVRVQIALRDPVRSFFLPQSLAPACGNGVVEDEEACDDYDRSSGDGCSSSCAFEPGIHRVPSPDTEKPELPPQNARRLDLSPYDDGSLGWAAVRSPFPIEIYGRRYAGVLVHESGVITFDLSTAEDEPQIPSALPEATGHDMLVALAGATLEDYDGLVWTETNLLAIDLTSGDAHVQVRFHRDGAIELRFGEVGGGNGAVASGLQERTGRLGSNSFTCAGPCSLDQVPVDQSVRFQ